MQHQAEQQFALDDVGTVAKGHRRDTLHPSTSEPETTGSVRDLKRFTTSRRAPPTAEEISAAADAAETRERRDGIKTPVVRRLPKLKPGQTCSIKDLKGCLAGRGTGPAPTIEELNETVAQAAVKRYLRSFA
ncbi:hypothetical protein [Cupriavidus pauculus]|uniref:hypothetical protein n=1 Tax=Cupriavidus pauculus TaxID=82633 RepID=UPI0011AF00B3|nr:hypothetical protein [Cupriavidus pauculus]